MPYAWSLGFLFFRPLTEVLCLPSSKMVPCILNREQQRFLSIWWNFCIVVCFRVVFSSSWENLYFFFNFYFFDSYASNIFLVLVCFFSVRSDFFLYLLVLFLSSFVIFRFSLLVWHIFLSQTPSFCHDCISSQLVLGFLILFHFWQTVWCHSCILDPFLLLSIL